MLLILPTGVNYQTERLPVVTFTIMGMNVALYLVSLIMHFSGAGNSGLEEHNDWLVENLGLIPAEPKWYALVTSLFVHAGFFHILGNMIYLFLFGCCVEDLIGRWQYAVFYLVGGLTADLGHVLASAGRFESMLPLVGASGAISACMGGFAVLLHGNKIDFKWFAFFFFRFFNGEFALPAWLVISFWFLKDLAYAILSYSVPGGGGGVAFAAHIGGFAGGAAMAAGWKLYEKRRAARAAEYPAGAATGIAAAEDDLPPSIYLYEHNAQIGPFTLNQISGMLAIGSVSRSAVYWQEGMADWRAVDELGL